MNTKNKCLSSQNFSKYGTNRRNLTFREKYPRSSYFKLQNEEKKKKIPVFAGMMGFGFTLVELIVVITILAILSTIAFLSFSGYSSNARDSVRLEDMSNLSQGLSLYQTKAGNLPLPERKIDITAGATTIGYQGYADTQVLSLANLSDTKDPIDATRYVYSINKAQTKYQILGYLENNNSIAYLPIDQAYATPTTYANRYITTKGDKIGIILNINILTPLATNLEVASGSISNTGYIVYFSSIESSTGNTLISSLSAYQPTLSQYDPNLVGYWDMQTTTNSGSQILLKDLSQNGNDGICYNSGTNVNCGMNGWGPQFIAKQGMSFDGVDDTIRIPDTGSSSLDITDDLTIFAKINNVDTNSQSGTYIATKYTAYLLDTWVSSDCPGSKITGTFYYSGGNSLGVVNSPCYTYPSNSIITAVTRTNKTFTTYYNGSALTLYSESGASLVSNNQPFVIGGHPTTNTRAFKGNIENIRTYNRALSASEISTLYNATK